MRSRRPSSEHQEAVARRLAQLSAQLSAAHAEPVPEQLPEQPAAGGEWWSEHTQVAPRPPLRVVVAPDEPEEWEPLPVRPVPAPVLAPPALPVPGRHAARRSLLGGLVPETLRGRGGLGPGQVAAVAVLVAIGLALTCWWVVRGDPEPATPLAPVTAAGAGGEALVPSVAPDVGPAPVVPDDSAGATAPGTVTVDVAGKVRRPGIVVLDAGARVVDAVEQAGGARPGVSLTSLNLARVLVDGEQIVVGAPVGSTGVAPPAVAPVVPGGQPAALVDLNLATQAELETLPEVGPVTAAAIIAWRDEHGGFSAVTELLEVDGIGDATLAQLAPLVTV